MRKAEADVNKHSHVMRKNTENIYYLKRKLGKMTNSNRQKVIVSPPRPGIVH